MGKEYLNQKVDFYRKAYEEKVFSENLERSINLRLDLLKHAKHQILAHKWGEMGVLEACMHHGRPEFYINEGGKKKYLPVKDVEIARKIAQRDYEKRLIHVIEREEEMWKRVLGGWKPAEGVIESFGKARQSLIKPMVDERSQIIEAWQNQKYQGKRFSPDDMTEFYTRRGGRVRSKSEVLIADMLYEATSPYLYEFPVKLGNYIVHPDFMVLNKRTMEVFIWEHLGKVDDPNYVEENSRKLIDYANHGWIPGKNLLLTFESAKFPLSTRLVKTMIQENLI
jgi:hypothetical protein